MWKKKGGGNAIHKKNAIILLPLHFIMSYTSSSYRTFSVILYRKLQGIFQLLVIPIQDRLLSNGTLDNMYLWLIPQSRSKKGRGSRSKQSSGGNKRNG